VSRFAADVHTGGEALRRLTADLSDEDFRETWRRLCLLYDVVDPPPEPTKG
jgi:hypothetical protein